uniref:Uncharacterized protein n=1 Tax=Attheya septentrionalis TaxID=420275 RepID=A0A7S2UAZ9_9STRA|mmetsp:Transcript_18017/g.32664  ORF Transcript_18017/g.32664 Transcript_18017/m.32664 type:complete len:315 (+) Transcript_18017:143-1087(+)
MVRILVLLVGVPVVNAFAPPTARAPFGALSKRRCTSNTHHHRNTNLLHPSSLYTDRKYNKSTTAREVVNGIQLADLLYDETSLAFDAWEWTANLGAPAALVAGAVLVTMSETRGEFAPRQSDRKWVRVAKQLTRLFLLSSFALEVISIFVSTVTGTVLLSHGAVAPVTKAIGYGSPLGLLKHHHEFEYLTIRIGFLQGLLNWLAAVALEIMIPKEKEPLCARRMNAFMTTCLFTIIFWIMAFYNHHLTFYGNYWHMLARYGLLFRRRFFCGQFRPMSLLYGPSSLLSIFLGWRAFNTPPDTDDVDDADEKKSTI